MCTSQKPEDFRALKPITQTNWHSTSMLNPIYIIFHCKKYFKKQIPREDEKVENFFLYKKALPLQLRKERTLKDLKPSAITERSESVTPG